MKRRNCARRHLRWYGLAAIYRTLGWAAAFALAAGLLLAYWLWPFVDDPPSPHFTVMDAFGFAEFTCMIAVVLLALATPLIAFISAVIHCSNHEDLKKLARNLGSRPDGETIGDLAGMYRRKRLRADLRPELRRLSQECGEAAGPPEKRVARDLSRCLAAAPSEDAECFVRLVAEYGDASSLPALHKMAKEGDAEAKVAIRRIEERVGPNSLLRAVGGRRLPEA